MRYIISMIYAHTAIIPCTLYPYHAVSDNNVYICMGILYMLAHAYTSIPIHIFYSTRITTLTNRLLTFIPTSPCNHCTVGIGLAVKLHEIETFSPPLAFTTSRSVCTIGESETRLTYCLLPSIAACMPLHITDILIDTFDGWPTPLSAVH